MLERVTWFVDVILPLSLPNLYTYRVPDELKGQITAGQRVAVQFGKNKLYSALVRKIHQNPPLKYQAKFIHSLLDSSPIVTETQFQLWEWISTYYMCSIGEVMNAALPSGLKLSSETKIVLHPAFVSAEEDSLSKPYDELTDKEYLIVEAIGLRSIITMAEAVEIIDQKIVYPVIKSLLDKQVIILQEELIERYRPKYLDYVSLNAELKTETKLKSVLDQLERKAGKQLDIIMAYLRLSGWNDQKISEAWVSKMELLKLSGASDTTLKALVKKNILELKALEVGRINNKDSDPSIRKELNESQKMAIGQIKEQFSEKDIVLLHGVTSSGKTEIYIKLIEEELSRNRQVLYLLPEIALTTQIINRLQKVFGSDVGVYHSRFNENERVEIWNAVLGKKLKIILGARSSLFLPFSDLGLILVDEEHDSSFKQYDPAPRYSARDSALFLARLHRAKVLLGSATPSIESFYNAQTHKFGFVELKKRYGDILLPEMEVVDIRESARKKQMKSHFSPQLMEGISNTLKNKEQVLLFQNRRGFSPSIECDDCAWTPQCRNCDVSLTYHKVSSQMRCHYCGYRIPVPVQCAACGLTNLNTIGFGTEKIEEDLRISFPQARISRMDLDATRTKNAHKNIIAEFENRNIDILVGTQMITKGLDFDHVTLVGILNADSSLHFPDFRSFERSYQLMVQVAGRSGRKNKRGKVIIQTHNPQHKIIKEVIDSNYLEMYSTELIDRKSFHYPPFTRLIKLTLKSRDLDILNESADFFASELRLKIRSWVLGPEFPLVARVKNEYLKSIMVKTDKESSVHDVKLNILHVSLGLKNKQAFKSVKVQIDVDPL